MRSILSLMLAVFFLGSTFGSCPAQEIKANDIFSKLQQSAKFTMHINFDTDKAAIKPEYEPELKEVAAMLISNPSLSLVIEGHTDNQGQAGHNRKLSQDRARSVAEALSKLGVNPSRLATVGMGPDQPVAPNDTPEGRAMNRRIEFVKR